MRLTAKIDPSDYGDHGSRFKYRKTNGSWNGLADCINKLGEYEDAEEAGLLKVLPIEINGRAWIIDDNTVIPVRIMDYQIGDDGLAAHVECLAPPAWITINAARLYKSKKEAEAALRELRELRESERELRE